MARGKTTPRLDAINKDCIKRRARANKRRAQLGARADKEAAKEAAKQLAAKRDGKKNMKPSNDNDEASCSTSRPQVKMKFNNEKGASSSSTARMNTGWTLADYAAWDKKAAEGDFSDESDADEATPADESDDADDATLASGQSTPAATMHVFVEVPVRLVDVAESDEGTDAGDAVAYQAALASPSERSTPAGSPGPEGSCLSDREVALELQDGYDEKARRAAGEEELSEKLALELQKEDDKAIREAGYEEVDAGCLAGLDIPRDPVQKRHLQERIKDVRYVWKHYQLRFRLSASGRLFWLYDSDYATFKTINEGYLHEACISQCQIVDGCKKGLFIGDPNLMEDLRSTFVQLADISVTLKAKYGPSFVVTPDSEHYRVERYREMRKSVFVGDLYAALDKLHGLFERQLFLAEKIHHACLYCKVDKAWNNNVDDPWPGAGL